MKSYPVNLVGLDDRRCVVVGGGAIAARKVAGLIAAGVRPVVISPTLQEDLVELQSTSKIEHLPRGYHPGDLEGAFLVIAASDDPALNQQVWEAASGAGILVNVVDSPAMCNFFTPAVVRRGDFVLSIATGGTAPALGARLRWEMESSFGSEYETMTNWCAALRPVMMEVFSDPHERAAGWYALVDSPVLNLLAAGQFAKARAWIAENLGEQLAEVLPSEPQGYTHEQL